MKHSWIVILFIVIVISVGFGLFTNPLVNTEEKSETSSISQKQTTTPKPVDHTASFAIFTNGTFRIFTDPKYHNQSADVFIENPEPNVIHVKKENITYQDFFNTLPMKLEKNCLTTGTGQVFCDGVTNKLRFFINGVEDPNALARVIMPNDRLLVTFGNLTDAQVKSQEARIPDAL